MFINLTNHPSAFWDEKQMSAAREQYGDIVDMPFPKIPPHWDGEQVRQTAVKYFRQIQAILPDPQPADAVHLMGEQVFCFKLLRLLIDAGYTVVASTTLRNDKVLPNGNIEKIFDFVRFRKY